MTGVAARVRRTETTAAGLAATVVEPDGQRN
ncbi:MAG: hypothetical protein JWN96_4234, partial [Mycobacterium sp.]|nr:hypothetical protein [Mycobacterium sp.]